MNACNICGGLPSELLGVSVSEIPALAAHVEELSTDFKTWTTLFRCKVCGQIWEERYESKGHANVPSVRRISGA
jgi:hypothetical protein